MKSFRHDLQFRFRIFFWVILVFSFSFSFIAKGQTAAKQTHGQVPVINVACGVLGVESGGWGSWIAEEGYHPMGSAPVFFAPMAAPLAPRFNIVSGAGNDPCSVGAAGPVVPIVSPGFGNFSIQIGQPQTDGLVECTNTGVYPPSIVGSAGNGCAERLHCPFTVTAADTNFIYSYAIFVENPDITNNPHTAIDAPFAEIYILAPKPTGTGVDTVPCSHRRYTANLTSSSTPGFFNASCVNQPAPDFVSYKPWTIVGVNLTQYLAKTLTVVITNADCGKGGHFCHSYWDFQCAPLTNTNTPFCLGSQTTFCGPPSLSNNVYTYQWYHNSLPFNPANQWTIIPGATSQCYSTTPSATDTFMVNVAQGSGCNFKIPVVPKPNGAVANFHFSTGCGGVSMFTDSSHVTIGGAAITGYQWTFPSGTPATAATATASVTFPPGTYTVTLVVATSSGCHDTIRKIINATGLPLAAFSTTTVCVGDSTHLTDLTTPVAGDPFVSWNWTLPGGSPATSTLVNPVSIFTPGTHSVTLVVTTQSGCQNTLTKPVNVFGLPQPAFTSPPVCVGLATTITNTSTPYAGDPITQTNWTFPGGNPATSTATNPTVTFPIGTYTLSLVTISAAGCKDSTKVPVTVNPPPVAGLKGANACFNNQNSFTDLSVGNNTISTWGWDFGHGNISALQNPAHTFSTPGVHTVTLVVTNNFGCKDTNTVNVVVNPLPAVNFTSVPVCKGDSTCFTNTSTISSGAITGWAWNFGDLPSGTANTSTAQAPCHVFTGLGPYNVVLTATSDSSCQSNVTLPATINSIPKANFIPQNGCVNAAVHFTDASTSAGIPINLWNWDFNSDGVTDATVQNPSYVYTTAGNYTVTLIVANTGGCRDTVSIPIKVYPPPVANFVGTNSGCAPVCNQYTDSSITNGSTITTYAWNFPGGNPSGSSQPNPLVCYSNPGTYGASLSITSNYGCRDSISLNPMVNVYAWPTAAFCISPDMAPATDPTFSFCNLWSSDVVQWTWSFGDNDSDIVNTSPVHSYSAVVTNNDFYNFKVCINVKNQHGCWDSICHYVEIVPEFEFYIPNTFTPNNDFINETFYGKCRGVKEYNIWIFDRWGNLLWDCHKQDKNTNWDNTGQDGLSSACRWDGKVVPGGFDMSGSSHMLSQEDVYVWKVKLTDVFDKVHTYVGNVNIVR